MESVRKILRYFFFLAIPLIQNCVLQAAEPATELPEVEVSIVEGSQYQLCQDYAAELKAHKATTRNHCGVAIPVDNPDYVLMSWEAIDPATNIELVKTMYYWRNFGRSVGAELYDRQNVDRSKIDEEILAIYWTKVEAQVLALIKEGKVDLQHSRFDIDFDGANEDVYRMTPIERNMSAIPPQEQEIHEVEIVNFCGNFELPGASKDYVYYTPTSGVPNPERAPFIRSRLVMGDFFSWKGRIYWASGEGNILEPHDGAYPNFVQVCSITSKQVEGRNP